MVTSSIAYWLLSVPTFQLSESLVNFSCKTTGQLRCVSARTLWAARVASALAVAVAVFFLFRGHHNTPQLLVELPAYAVTPDGMAIAPDGDLVVASVHVSRRQTREQLTARVLAGIRSPNVDVIAHPAGRYIGTRDDLDLDWDPIFTEAARTIVLISSTAC